MRSQGVFYLNEQRKANKTFVHSLFLFFFYCRLAEEFCLEKSACSQIFFRAFDWEIKLKEGPENWILHLPVDSLSYVSLHLFNTFNYTLPLRHCFFPSLLLFLNQFLFTAIGLFIPRANISSIAFCYWQSKKSFSFLFSFYHFLLFHP